MKIGDEIPQFKLKGTDGRMYGPENYANQAICVIFSCNHCPYANAYDNRLKALQSDYPEMRFIMINSNDARKYPEDSFSNMVACAQKKGYNFPYVYDETQEIARAFTAECTPHVFLFDKEHKLCYEGRIDDNWKEEDLATELNLRDALESITSNEEVAVTNTNPLGCSIKWKK